MSRSLFAFGLILAGLGLISCSPLKFSAVDSFDRTVASAVTHPAQLEGQWLLLQADPEQAAGLILGLLKDSPDPFKTDLGTSLARLPDFNDGIKCHEATALKAVYELVYAADSVQRRLLADLASENKSEFQYSGSLQGLLWMAEDGLLDEVDWEAVDREYFADYAWEALPGRTTSPQEILDYLINNYSYLINLRTAETRQTFFRRKFGDCTEFSLLAGYLLSKHGYEAWALTSRPSRLYAHVSIIYRDQDGYWLLDASRCAINKILTEKRDKARGYLGPADQFVLQVLGGFDRLFGPEAEKEDLVEVYRKSAGREVPYKIIPYWDFMAFIEKYGYEARDWYTFKD